MGVGVGALAEEGIAVSVRAIAWRDLGGLYARERRIHQVGRLQILICEDLDVHPVYVHRRALPAGQHGLSEIQLELKVGHSAAVLVLFSIVA